MKHLRTFATLIVGLWCSITANAHDFEVDGIYYNIISETKVEVTYQGSSYNAYNDEYKGSITIPATVIYDGVTYSVTNIGESAFNDCGSLTAVTFSENSRLTSIGDVAFTDCKKLISIIIPEGVTYIGACAFERCSSLTSITIPESMKSISYWAFRDCIALSAVHICSMESWCEIHFADPVGGIAEALSSNPLMYAHDLHLNNELVTELVIPKTINFIPSAAFHSASITSVYIPEGVSSINDFAFFNCNNLTSVYIPKSITSIGYKAFEGCSNIERVELNCIGIGSWFSENTSLKEVILGNNITSIYNNALSGCSSLTSINIPESVTSIGEHAFSGCSSITSINIPESVTSIGEYAFSGCSNLTSINIPKSIVTIGEEVFSMCPNLERVTFNCPNIKGWFSGRTNLKEVVFGDNVSTIEDDAFYGCSGLTSITIPNSVERIGFRTFYNCTSLTAVHINSLKAWCNISFDGLTSNPLNCAHNLYLNGELVTELTIPDGVTGIGEYAFGGCTSITSITIPESVTSIGSCAFEGCTGLTAVYANSLEAWCNIKFEDWGAPNYANPLMYAKNLYLNGELVTELTIPNTITSIGHWTFAGCSSLTSITIPNSVTSIGNNVFDECSGLKEVIIEDGNTTLDLGSHFISGCCSSSLFGSCNLEHVYMGRNLVYGTDLYESPFDGNEISSIEIGGCVTLLNESLFNYSSLTSIISNAVVAPICSNDVFRNVDKSIPVYVPVSSGMSYRSAQYWSEFTNIRTIDGSEIKEDFSDWTSYNQGTANSTSSRAYIFTTSLCDTLTFDWSVSSESGYDHFIVTLNGVEVLKKSGEASGTYQQIFTSSRTDTLVVKYTKNKSVDRGYDCAKVYNVKLKTNIASGICGDDLVWKLTKKGELVIEGTGKMYDYDNDYSQSVAPWNGYKEAIDMVKIGEGVTKMGNCAFSGCSNIISIIIPESMISIGSFAFEDCISLTSITIPESVDLIEEKAFVGCGGLSDVHIRNLEAWFDICFATLESNPLSYADNIYLNGELVTELIIPNTVATIKKYAFCGCNNLISITIPACVDSIGNGAFMDCCNLAAITSEATTPPVVSESSTFYGIDKTTPIYVPASSVAAYRSAEYWSEFVNIQPKCIASGICGDNLIWKLSEDGVMTIKGTGVMYNYVSSSAVPWNEYRELINTISIGEGVTSISDYAFYECNNIISIAITSNVMSIGSNAFYGCSNLSAVYAEDLAVWCGIEFDGYSSNPLYYAGNLYVGGESVTELIIPNTVAEIKDYAFCNCSGITSVVIPENVTSIGSNAFYECSNLDAVHVEDLAVWCGIEFYGYSANPLCYAGNLYVDGELVTELIVPNAVTEIKDYAFYNCSSITSVVVPESVMSIGSNAFYGCSNLAGVHIEDLATWCGIDFEGSYANPLYYAGNLYVDGVLVTEVIVPNTVTEIEDYAFYGCNSLTSIVISENVTSIGGNTFSNCGNLASIVVAEDNAAYDSREGCNAIIQTNSETLILGCSKTIIPQGVAEIGSYAFAGCGELTSIIIPESVNSIMSYAFDNCYALREITFEDAEETLRIASSRRQAPFSSCPIENVYLGRNLSYSATTTTALFNSRSLTTVIIGAKVTSLGNNMFYRCSNITSITCHAVTPPSASSRTFNGVNTSIPVYVPATSVSDYMSATGWRSFLNITGVETGITPSTLNPQLSTEIFDLQGRRITDTKGLKGIYIVNGKKTVIK